MPKNTWAGIVIAGLSTLVGFALIWHMWPLAVLAMLTLVGTTIFHTFNYKRDYHIDADEVVRTEGLRTRLLASHV